jgi:hypothetical protein
LRVCTPGGHLRRCCRARRTDASAIHDLRLLYAASRHTAEPADRITCAAGQLDASPNLAGPLLDDEHLQTRWTDRLVLVDDEILLTGWTTTNLRVS